MDKGGEGKGICVFCAGKNPAGAHVTLSVVLTDVLASPVDVHAI